MIIGLRKPLKKIDGPQICEGHPLENWLKTKK